MDWRRWTVRALAVLVFVALPYALRHFCLIQNLSDGIYLATGIAVVLYTVETFYLRAIAIQQAETAIRPLLVSRIEEVTYEGHLVPSPRREFVLRNIGHGPALFVEIQDFTVRTQDKGSVRVQIDPADLVEATAIAFPVLKPRPSQAGGQRPAPAELHLSA